ncbi:MAG: hypothetical protein AAFY72_03615 [Cyanobacteria bacterium J06649_4]
MTDETPIYFIVEEPIAEETVVVDGERSGGDVGGGWGRRPSREDAKRKLGQQRVGIKPSVLKAQLQQMKGVVDDVFTEDAQNTTSETRSGFQLEEITLSVQVNGKGELSILGSGGELGGSGGITLKFTRPKS